MKERASFTFDKETIKVLDEFVNSGKYRNRSHAVEEAIKFLKEKESSFLERKTSEKEEKTEKEKRGEKK